MEASGTASDPETIVQNRYRAGSAHRSVGGSRLTGGPTDRATHKPPPRRKRRGGTGPTDE